jgi:hypothetical protein
MPFHSLRKVEVVIFKCYSMTRLWSLSIINSVLMNSRFFLSPGRNLN